MAVPGDDKKSGFKQSVKVTIEDKEGQKHTLRLPLPYRPKGEMFAVAETFQGGSRLQVVCEDGKRRTVIITHVVAIEFRLSYTLSETL